MIKLVAFDWNGTLLSDTKPSFEANNITFKTFGIKPLTLKEYQDTFTIPIIDFYSTNGYQKEKYLRDAAKIQNVFHPTYESLVTKTRTRSGAKKLLTWLFRNKIQSIIYSNHTKLEIIQQLNRLKIDKFITKVLARTTEDIHAHLHQRHKEQKLCDYIKELNLKPTEIVSIGDTCEEIEVGKTNDFHTVAITGGYNSTKRLKACMPDYLIHNLKDLIPIIKKLNSQ